VTGWQDSNGRDSAPPSTTKNDDVVASEIDRLDGSSGDTLIGRTGTINRPPAELYAYWRDFPKLATFMENVVSVEQIDAVRSHWVVKAPGGKTVEWDSVVTEENEGSSIAWSSAPDAEVRNSGKVEFREAPGGRGSYVTATIVYDPPGGTVGKLIAKIFQREPAIQARRDLRRFKQLMETGEIATSAWTRKQVEEENA